MARFSGVPLARTLRRKLEGMALSLSVDGLRALSFEQVQASRVQIF